MLSRRLRPALLVTLAACGAPASAPPRAASVDSTPAPAPLRPPLPARWVESGGATLLGPAVALHRGKSPGGTLVLLGGRRAVVHGDGTLETEATPGPEPLEEIVEVPVPSGKRLVGRGAHGVYRFDEPLGAPVTLARSEERLARLGAGPGLVAVWTGFSDLPRFLDVETGRPRDLAGLPQPPLRALAFVDMVNGAGIFEAAGLAITDDGGARWVPALEAAPGDALRATGLRRRGGGLRAFAYADGPDAAVDFHGPRLGPLEPQRLPPAEANVLRWIRATGRDPLEAVASGGLDLPGGDALVASHGLLARVDPRSGAIGELVDVARAKWMSPCGAGRAGQTAWIACTLADDAGRDLFDPFGVIKVPLAEPALAAERPALVRNGEAELRVSPSGGAMLLAPCSHDEVGSACVRQPDGKWKTISIEGELTERGAGPLADGRVAFLRGMFEGDEVPEPPADGKAAAAGTPPPDEDAHSRRLHVSIAGPDGKERHLAPIGFTPLRGYVRVQSPIEEDTDRTLRFVVEDGDGPFAVVAPSGKESAQAHRIPDAIAARLHAGRGVAVGEGRVLASLDGGATWSEIPAAPPVLEAARMASTSYEEPGQLTVSELGAKVGPMLRLGWGVDHDGGDPHTPGAAALDGGPSHAPAPPVTVLGRSPPVPSGPEQVLACTSQGAVPGTPPLEGGAQVRQLLAGKPVKTPGVRHESASWSGSRAGMLDTVALLDEEGPEGSGSAPAKWTFRWHDPSEIGGKVRTASVPAPRGATWSTGLRFAAASAGRAIFALRSGGKLRLVRLSPTGAAEMAEVAGDLVPAGEIAFGEGPREVIAWARETQVMVWLPGERPRVIARLGTHATRTLGSPTPAGVPLLLGASDWSLQRLLPIPPLDRSAADPPSARPSLDGWTRLSPLPPRLDALPVCAGKAAGARFALARPALRAEIDGVGETAAQAIYDVRIDAGGACLAGVTATLSPDHRNGKPPAAPPAGKGPAAFVRVDLLGKRAEGGERGLPPAGVRRMTCAFGAKPR